MAGRYFSVKITKEYYFKVIALDEKDALNKIDIPSIVETTEVEELNYLPEKWDEIKVEKKKDPFGGATIFTLRKGSEYAIVEASINQKYYIIKEVSEHGCDLIDAKFSDFKQYMM